MLGIASIRCRGGLPRRGRFCDCLADGCEGDALAFWHDKHRARRAVETGLPGAERERRASCPTDVGENVEKISNTFERTDQSPLRPYAGLL